MDHTRELRSLIARVRRRWFACVALCTVGRATGAAALPLLAAIGVDWLLQPTGRALLLLGVVTIAASAAAAGIMFWRMQRRPDDGHVARFIEERAEEEDPSHPLSDCIVSAVQVTEKPAANGAFAALIVRQAIARLRAIDPAVVISKPAMRRAALQAAGGMAFLVIALIASASVTQRTYDAARLAWFPQSVAIAVVPGNARVVAGQPFRVRATFSGTGTTLMGFTPELVVSANGEQLAVAMTPVDGGFEFAFASIDRTFEYRVTAGAASSAGYTVTALFPPRVERIDLRYEYPSFTRLAPRDEEDAGDIYGPAGTRVRLRIHTDKPVTEGLMTLTEGAAVPLRSSGERSSEAELVLSKDNSYRIRLADEDGLSSTSDTEYFIRLMDDRPPEVRILRPAGDQGIMPLEEVTIEARADDDYGIEAFDLVYSVAGRGERSVPFRRASGTDVARIGSHLIAAEELKVQPGDVITYFARARDVARGKRSTETRSDIFFLEVKPFGEEFVSAQSQAMGGGASGTQIDSLIAAQKEIINATWNLERRSHAGRSSEDLKAVAAAQAELRARAEQMAAGARRRGRNPFLPQQVSLRQPPRRTSGPDPVSQAIDSMTRAVEQLEASRTKDAIPHEMAALQGLLRAQAEIRRRQVMQQSASGASSGGSNRADQDLSALFDRELQRQQRTNYETRSRVDERPDQKDENSALDRIKDLARRQEDLSRRQRELDERNLSAEELKRQLETLTREQMELQRQMEELQKGSTGSEGSRGAKGSEGATGSQQQRAMREAAEQMRRAAEELKRQNTGGAAQNAQNAAERLRQIEQQARGSSADARQRAAGELQMEAQQVAEAQRRVAAESSRVQKDGQNASADTHRRLASEKDRLAERVDEMQRAAQQIARAGDKQGDKVGASNAAREAAQQLQHDRIGQRLRESADQSRAASAGGKGGDPRKAADADEQLARALERVADTLGGGARAEAGKLADSLQATGQIRDRLNRLEQQIRETEAKQKAASTQGASGQQQGNQQQKGEQAGQQPQRGQPQTGQPQPGSEGRQGRAGRQGQGGSGQGGELQRLREEYARELEKSRDTLGRLEAEQRSGTNMATPEQHQYSRSAPGTESFKQDFSGWESMRKDIDLALERYEAAASDRLAKKLGEDRLNGGGSDRVPEAYRRLIARYYESLARVKR
jgi:hypothetical protein